MNVAIIGAGPAGLSAAYALTRKGCAVTVFEASDAVGGMARTIPLWGQLVDLGPHRFFSSDKRVNKVWLDAVGDDYEMVSRLTRIYYQDTFFDYPLKAFNALAGLGVFESLRCLLSYLYAGVHPEKDESTFDAWVTNRFGSRLFCIFFKSYSEKLWGISCKQLDADFAAQRIKKLSLFEAIKAALCGGGNKHKTLVDAFAYPKLGAGVVYERLTEKIWNMGGRIFLNTPVRNLSFPLLDNEHPCLTLTDGQDFTFDHIISSMPINELVRGMNAPDVVIKNVDKLRFRNTILVYLLIDGANLFSDQWIYVHSPDLQVGRISNFRNWLPTICQCQNDTILCLEYWCYDEDILWHETETKLIELGMREIYATCLVPKNTVKEGKIIKISKCYPVYAVGYKKYLIPVEQYLSGIPNLTVIGRYGAFKYNNQDHSILMGLLAGENIVDGKAHDLWKINTDYEYQESSKITATGLEKV
jgi:protoporphyrinogen oxidase